MSGDGLHIAPGFVPTQFAQAEAPGRGPDGVQVAGAAYDRRPRTSTFTCSTTNTGNGWATAFVTVGAPSLVKLLGTNLALAPVNRASLDAFWMPFGDPYNPPTEIFVYDHARRNNFVGPYAWLPRAGQYRITFGTDLETAAVVTFTGQIQEGVSHPEFLSAITSPASASVHSSEFSHPGGGVVADLFGSASPAIFLQRSLRIFNAGPNNAIIRFGPPLSAGYNVVSGGSVEFGQQYLGRDRVTATASLAAQLNILGALW